ncbi:MAG: hypothetical protein ACYC2K_07360 [Gemmatimonadales bacterium]
MSHHGNNPPPDIPEWLRKTLAHTEGEFPAGRLNPQDDGAVAVGIGHQSGKVVMQFPKNLNWIGFTPDQAIDIAQSLVEHARQCGSKKPLTLKVG